MNSRRNSNPRKKHWEVHNILSTIQNNWKWQDNEGSCVAHYQVFLIILPR